MAAFAILFLTLGLIIFNLFQSSTYKSIDKDVKSEVITVKKQPNMQQNTGPDPQGRNPNPDTKKRNLVLRLLSKHQFWFSTIVVNYSIKQA